MMKKDIQLISVNMGIFLCRLDYTIDWYYSNMKPYEFIGLRRLKREEQL
jgi:hypothetical protein